ncbi:MAG: hypothetical protein ABI411_17900 [Tahibacter sp.]
MNGRLWIGAALLALLVIATGGLARSMLAPLHVNQPADKHDRFDEAAEARTFYLDRRLPEGSRELPVEKLLAAREQMDKMAHVSSVSGQRYSPGESMQASSLSAKWTALGPGNVGGRVLALAIDPGNHNVLFAGAAGGGVWKSLDAGANWNPLSDTMANLAVASLAIDPTNTQVIYAGTGEGDGSIDSIRGAGLFKSLNGGTSWARLAGTTTSSWYFINDIHLSSLNSQRLVVANSTGVWTSQDGGSIFTRTQIANNCLYISSSVTAGVESWLASCGNGSQATVYRSTDASTWTAVLTEVGMGRTSLAMRGTRAYALAASYLAGPDRTGDGVGDYDAQLHALFRSDDSGQTWSATVRNTSPNWGSSLILSGYYSCATLTVAYGQGWYDNAIAIDPLNPDTVWVGGILLYRSDDGGFSWGRGPNIHPDHHVLVFDPGFNGTTNQMLYDGQDGGVYRLDNSRAALGTQPAAPGSGCTSAQIDAPTLNHGFAATQFYHGTPYPDGTRYIAGAQDNATRRGSDATGPNAWTYLTCGDGGYDAIDPTNTNVLYVGCNGLDIRKSTDGGAIFNSADSGIPSNESTIFIPPFALDPNNTQRLWFGGKHAWRSADAAANWTSASLSFANGTVSAIAIAPGNSNRVLMATSSGRVYRSDTATTDISSSAWTESLINAGGYVSSLAFAPNDSSTVYASVSTFGRPHILRSTDAGANWTNISGSGITGLPDVPALSVMVDIGDSSRLFAGTDVGVFTSADAGATWAVEITGFPNVSTEWLAMTGTAQSRSLFAFTHGRGAFRATLGPASDVIFANGFQ